MEENTQKAEYMYVRAQRPGMWTAHGLCFGSGLGNHVYVRAINFLQVWVDDVLVG